MDTESENFSGELALKQWGLRDTSIGGACPGDGNSSAIPCAGSELCKEGQEAGDEAAGTPCRALVVLRG